MCDTDDCVSLYSVTMLKPSLVAVAVIATACTSVSVSENTINAPPHPLSPRAPESVELFTAGPPPRPRVDIAVIRASVSGLSIADNDARIQEMRKRAAALGCDGLVLAGTDSGWVGTCIVYTGPMLAPMAPAAPAGPSAAN